jgi:hypothetical protein
MQTRAQIQDSVKELIQDIIQFNRLKYREYQDICFDIQRTYGIDDYVDLLWNLDKMCYTLDNNEEAINALSDTEIVELEKNLLSTAQFIGLSKYGSYSENDYINSITDNIIFHALPGIQMFQVKGGMDTAQTGIDTQFIFPRSPDVLPYEFDGFMAEFVRIYNSNTVAGRQMSELAGRNIVVFVARIGRVSERRANIAFIELSDVGMETDGVVHTLGAIIAHEMSHVHAFYYGYRMEGENINSKAINEMNACAVENNYRAMHNLPQRQIYTLDDRYYVSVPQWVGNGWVLKGEAWNIIR